VTDLGHQSRLDSNNNLCELASLYTLGALSVEDDAAYEAHLSAGCRVCRAEVASLRKVSGAIGLTADPVPPPAELRNRLMNAISKTMQVPAGGTPGVILEKDGLLVARSEEMEWHPGQLPGIFSKVLFNDVNRGYTTTLVRMSAGVHYPSHRHAGVEELFLLEGDLNVEDLSMRPGDYCRAEASSIHGEIFTSSGCMFMVSSSHHDEILA
jgi:anti-sigma factor ChrR (cupin superfamily)